MNCSNCGHKYKKGDKYCGNCGNKINIENKFISFLKKNKINLLIITIFIIAIIVLTNILNYVASPVYKANKYFNAIIHNDMDAIYKTINKDDNEFMNITKLREKYEPLNILNYQIVSVKNNNTSALVTYKYDTNDYTDYASVLLKKDINNTWKVESGKVSENIIIKLPKNSTATLDGISLNNYLKENENFNIYEIPYMITGEYKLDVTLNDGTKIADDIYIASDTTYSLGYVELMEETKNNLKETAKSTITELYNAVIKTQDINELNIAIKDIYKDINYYNKLYNFKLNSFDITSIDYVKSKYNRNGNLVVSYSLEYDYNISINDQTYSSTNRDIISIEYDQNNNIKEILNGISFPYKVGVNNE